MCEVRIEGMRESGVRKQKRELKKVVLVDISVFRFLFLGQKNNRKQFPNTFLVLVYKIFGTYTEKLKIQMIVKEVNFYIFNST